MVSQSPVSLLTELDSELELMHANHNLVLATAEVEVNEKKVNEKMKIVYSVSVIFMSSLQTCILSFVTKL